MQLETIGVSGGIKKQLSQDRIIQAFGLNDKIYFETSEYDADFNYFIIFDQQLRKWTREKLYKCTVYCLANNYNSNSNIRKDNLYGFSLAGFDSNTYIGYIYCILPISENSPGFDVYMTKGLEEGDDDIKQQKPIQFYLKTKEFKNGTLSRQKSLTQIWFNYDFIDKLNSRETYVNIKVITNDGKIKEYKNALPKGENLTKCILIPNDMQNADSYTFEIYGQGFIRIYAMERIDRTDTR